MSTRSLSSDPISSPAESLDDTVQHRPAGITVLGVLLILGSLLNMADAILIMNRPTIFGIPVAEPLYAAFVVLLAVLGFLSGLGLLKLKRSLLPFYYTFGCIGIGNMMGAIVIGGFVGVGLIAVLIQVSILSYVCSNRVYFA
jgi:hypothetical protein